ncbi:hypothetical protein AALB39_27485 [Lachnospiraceae bacterium 54-53]
MTNKLKEMMKQLIDGAYDCNDFSYDFPYEMFGLTDTKAAQILDDMPEICAAYDPYKEDEPDILNGDELIQKVKEVYQKLIEAGY